MTVFVLLVCAQVFATTPALPTPPPASAKAANAAVPATLQEDLRFIVVTPKREFGGFQAVVPQSWEYDEASRSWMPPEEHQPPADERFGFSSLRVSTTCAGTCAPKDWNALVDKHMRAFGERGYIIESDETVPGRRTVVSLHTDKRVYSTAWWKPDANRWFLCEAEIDHRLAQAAMAFQAACSAMRILDWR